MHASSAEYQSADLVSTHDASYGTGGRGLTEVVVELHAIGRAGRARVVGARAAVRVVRCKTRVWAEGASAMGEGSWSAGG